MTQRRKGSECCLKTGAKRPAQGGVATNLPFVIHTVPAIHNRAKHDEAWYTPVGGRREPRHRQEEERVQASRWGGGCADSEQEGSHSPSGFLPPRACTACSGCVLKPWVCALVGAPIYRSFLHSILTCTL